MIISRDARLEYLSVHLIGSEHEERKSNFSASGIPLDDEMLSKQLLHFFLHNFSEPQYFQFAGISGSLEENTMFQAVTTCFDDDSFFHDWSLQVAKWLDSQSSNHFIKSGELLIAKIGDILFEDEMCDAIAIFKIENRASFLHFISGQSTLLLELKEGVSLDKMDKACLIINKESDTGFTILNVDHVNRNKDAKYWREDFLHIEPRINDYHNTKEFIQLTKEFVSERLPKQFDADKSQQAHTMQRSLDYFKKQESFDTEEYATKVFNDDKVVEAFKEFKDDYENYRQIELFDQFDISDQAVKKQSRVFKSVIKLDKNFHIYVHGNKNMIQKGTDDEGRKYYILYYDEEN